MAMSDPESFSHSEGLLSALRVMVVVGPFLSVTVARRPAESYPKVTSVTPVMASMVAMCLPR